MKQKVKKKEETHFVVTYKDPVENKVLSLKCKKIEDSRLGLSFISLSQFLFQESSLVANPAEENLKKKFMDTKTLHLSIYSILSIEEVGINHRGLPLTKERSNKDKSNLIRLPKDIITLHPL